MTGSMERVIVENGPERIIEKVRIVEISIGVDSLRNTLEKFKM